MKRKIFRILSIIFLNIILSLLFLELFLRVNPKFGYVYNAFKVDSVKADFMALQPSKLLGYEHVPNLDCPAAKIKTNSYGLIGKEYGFHKDKETFRILVLGDSIAAQGFSCDFLEDYLNKSSNVLSQSRYKNFQIWNAGVTSYDVRRYAIYLENSGINYKPDIVLIFFCLNDFDLDINTYYKTKDGADRYYFPVSEVSKMYNVSPLLMKYSHLYRFITLKLNSYLFSKKKTQKGIDPLEENGRHYLGKIKEICGRHKIPLFTVIFPYLMPFDEYSDYQKKEYQTICKVAKDLQVSYLNLRDYLPEKDIKNLRMMNEDYMHPSREGHQIIASLIYSYLQASFFNTKKFKITMD
ncbi:MAG: SGNH/GDSL hydrolase family protein [Candidatus Omnitrophica bacterium]|nr:SGNH/GDSL hydrolase family protein [Candidatus Omnitrophota bacterium]